MLHRPMPQMRRQRGVAIVTALLLVALALTITYSLFDQQNVQAYSLENQRLKLQTRWILLGALDYSRVILKEDAQNSAADNLGEPWATELAETRLDDYVEKGRNDGEPADGVLSGNIVDATARYNLSNLALNRVVDQAEVAVLRRLLINLRLSPQLAQATAEAIARTQSKLIPVAPPPAAQPLPDVADTASASFTQVDDLLVVPGMKAEILTSLQDYVIFLPRLNGLATTVNINTASAEVLAARIATLTLSDARRVVLKRKTTTYIQLSDFDSALMGLGITGVNSLSAQDKVDVKSNFFIVTGKVRLDRATLETRSLVERVANTNTTKIVWIREN
jgi:general secretion pathway protein K